MKIGIYAIATRFPSIVSAIFGYFYVAWKEVASTMVKDTTNEEKYSEIYNDISKLTMIISIFLILGISLIFPVLIGNEYNDSYIHIPILIIAVYFANISLLIGGIFVAFKKTKELGKTTIITAILNVVINILLIPHIGIYAATISTLIANLYMCIYRSILVKKYITLEKKQFWDMYLLLIISTSVYYINNIVITSIAFILISIVILIRNKTVVKRLIKRN